MNTFCRILRNSDHLKQGSSAVEVSTVPHGYRPIADLELYIKAFEIMFDVIMAQVMKHDTAVLIHCSHADPLSSVDFAKAWWERNSAFCGSEVYLAPFYMGTINPGL